MPSPGHSFVSTREAISLFPEVMSGKRNCALAKSHKINTVIAESFRNDICSFLRAFHDKLKKDPPTHDFDHFLLHMENSGLIKGRFLMATSVGFQSHLDTLVIHFE